MALNNFFEINLPYGIKRNSNDEWFAFNREYAPIGFNQNKERSEEGLFSEFPIHTKYKNLTDTKLLDIAGDEKYVNRDINGKIHTILLYTSSTNPKISQKNALIYFDKLMKLLFLQRKA